MDKKKYRVHVRAIRTIISVPGKGDVKFQRGHIFKKPWPDLIELAGNDTKNSVLRLEEIKEEGNKK